MGTRTLVGTGPCRGSRWLGAALATVVLLLAGSDRSRAQDAPATPPASPAPGATSPWTDPAVLDRRFAEAIDAVEAACGTKFRVRPTWALSSRATVRKILRDELAPVMRNLGLPEDDAGDAADAMVAKYDVAAHRVHVIEGGAARLMRAAGAPELGEAELRVVLAHEATHALDFERFDLLAREQALRTPEALRVHGALIEGHAQLVAEQVAAAWGIPEAFTRFTAGITALPPIDDDRLRGMAEAAAAELGFGYVQGHAFFRAVHAARGREGVDAVLRTPPTSARSIERPAEWLAGGPATTAPDLGAVLERLKPLVGDAAWQTQSAEISEAALRTQGQAVAPDQRADFLKGFRDARVLVAAFPAEQRQVIVMALAFETTEDAARYHRQERSTVKTGTFTEGRMKITGSLTDGAGPDGGLAGYTVTSRVELAGRSVPTESSLAVLGVVVVEVVVVNTPELDRAARDGALARIDAFLKDPAAAAGRPAAEPVRLRGSSREVEVRVKGPDGKAVPRAVVEVKSSDGGRTRERLREGRARVWISGEATISVLAAADADDRRLPNGPVKDHAVATDATVVELTLPTDRTISGRALNAAGDPVEGAEVEAAAGDEVTPYDLLEVANLIGFGPDAEGRATTAADGSFTLRGLADGPYRLRLVDEDGLATDRIVVVAAGTTDVVLRRATPKTVSLRVVDADGKPVSRARITAFAARPSPQGPPDARTGFSGPDGRVELRGMPEHGGFRVSVEPPRARDDLAGLSGVDVANDAAPLVLPPGRVVRGRVVDAEGKPVRAEVRVGELGASDDGPPGYGRSVETSDDGRFTIRGLRREPVALRAHPLGGRLWDEDDRPFTTVGVETSDVRLVLVRPATVEVRVVGPDGQPVRSADVAVRWGSRTSSETVEGGIVTVPRRAGEQLVGVARAVGSDGAPLAPGHAAVRSGIDTVELRLAPGAEVRGRVVNASGEPVAGATVGVSPKREATADGLGDVFGLLETWGSARTSGPQALVRTTTGADGGFVARGLPTGACVVSVLPPAPYGPREDVAADGGGKGVEIVVATSVTYRVTVVDAEGRPLAGASVKVIRRKELDAATTQYLHDPVLTTDASGEVTVGPLRPADGYGLEVAPPDDRADLLEQSFSRWTPGELRVELAFARTLRGRVVDGRGAPIAGARVSVLGRDTASIRDVPTGTDGRFRLPGVPREGVRLIARLRSTPDSVEETGTLAVAEGEDDVVVQIDRHSTWRFTVDAKPGRTLTLWFGPPADRSMRAAQVGEDGQCVLESVPVRRATVFVPTADGDDRCGYLPDVEVSDAPIVVPMQPSRTITIRLKLPADARLERLDVLGPTGPLQAQQTDDGRWIVTGLPAGRFPVKAKARSPSAWMYATVEAEAGTEVEVVPK